MGRYCVVDHYLNEIKEYDDLSSINLLKVVKQKVYDSDCEGNEKVEKSILLSDGTEITQYGNGFEILTDKNCVVYAPVYDCSRCEVEEYSMYEEEDLIGYANMEYDYRDYIDF